VRHLFTIVKLVVVVGITGALVAATLAVIAPQVRSAAAANRTEPESVDLNVLNTFTVRSYVHAADGSLISTLQGPESNRSPVGLADMSDQVKLSVLAVEDASFYDHAGVNLKATFRALLENLSAAGVEQGGSTITQQLVKNVYLTSNQTLDRKSKEVALALRLEQQLIDTAKAYNIPDPEREAKDKILETYLNTIYFGSGAYGVEAAAQTYWGKHASELDWPEAALLAALISSPVGYDPTNFPDRAKRQRSLAIDRLVQLDQITDAQANTYKLAPLPRVKCTPASDTDPTPICGKGTEPAPTDYFAEEVKQALLNDPQYNLGDTYAERYSEVFNGGLKITTTIDPGAQAAQEQAVREGVPKNSIGVTAAAVSIEPSTGAVRAMVGGPGFDQFKYNIATHQPGRQTGSSFKTFVLLAAMEEGNIPDDSVGGGGSFKNPGGDPDPYKVTGKGGTLTSVTQASSNGAFVRLGITVGLDNVVDTAKRLGLSSELQPVLSLPLGVEESTPIEMASAYSAIPNGGIRQPYYLIDTIEDRDGNVVYQHAPNGTRAFSAQTACLTTKILKANVDGGTGTKAKLGKQQAAGKTGTTEDHADAWFIGFTPYLVTAVWLGNPDHREPMYRLGPAGPAFGGTYPARIWHDFNVKYHEGRDLQGFPDCDTTRRGTKVTGPGEKSPSLGYSSSSSSNSTTRNTTRAPSRTPATTVAPAAETPAATAPAPAPTQPPAPSTTKAPVPKPPNSP
jgi:penicillin-binding protein 1A